MGREYGAEERIEETVDFPVAIEPVRPTSSMVLKLKRAEGGNQVRLV